MPNCLLLAVIGLLVSTLDGFVFPSTTSITRSPHIGSVSSRSRSVPSFLLSSKSASRVSSNEELLPGIAAIDQLNDDLLEKLDIMREQPYFRLYSVDILGSCEYMPQELKECYSETCEIYPVDDEEVGNDQLVPPISPAKMCSIVLLFSSSLLL